MGSFNLSGIAPAPRGTPKIEISYIVDSDGILTVSAATGTGTGTGTAKEKFTIHNDKGRLTKKEIERMIKDSEMYAEDDNKMKEKIKSQDTLP